MTNELGLDFFTNAVAVAADVRVGRVWRAHDDGVLSGVTYPYPWSVGENVARCVWGEQVQGETVTWPDGWAQYSSSYTTGFPYRTHRDYMTPKPHRAGDPACTCGFYGYHTGDGGAWLTSAGYSAGVLGVVRMYGRMVRGSKGVRAERATILALVRPEWSDSPAGTARTRWSAVRARYGDLPVYATAAEAMAAHPLHH